MNRKNGHANREKCFLKRVIIEDKLRNITLRNEQTQLIRFRFGAAFVNRFDSKLERPVLKAVLGKRKILSKSWLLLYRVLMDLMSH